MVGVAKRVRTIDGMPLKNVIAAPTMPTTSVSHDGRNDCPSAVPNRNHEARIRLAIPTPGPEPGDADLHVDGEREHREQQQGDGPWLHRQHAEPVAAKGDERGADDAGDADAGGEELEQQEGEADHEEQVGDRRAGRGVEQLGDEIELVEAHDGDLVVEAAVVVDPLHGGVQGHAVSLQPIQTEHHVADRRHALVGARHVQQPVGLGAPR